MSDQERIAALERRLEDAREERDKARQDLKTLRARIVELCDWLAPAVRDALRDVVQ